MIAYAGYQFYRNGAGAAAEVAPISGDVNDFYSAFTGRSLYTGKSISPADQLLSVAAAIIPAVTGGELKAGKEVVEKLDSIARFTQKAISPKFSDEGSLAGKTLDEVTNALRNGSMTPSDLPINYVEVNGIRLVDNNRSAYVLKQAGISEDLWNWQTKNVNNEDLISRIRQKLNYNKLSDFGSDSVRITNGRR